MTIMTCYRILILQLVSCAFFRVLFAFSPQITFQWVHSFVDCASAFMLHVKLESCLPNCVSISR